VHSNRGKKGISTILVSVFMIAVIIVGLGAVSWGLNVQSKQGQVIKEMTVIETDINRERIELRDVRIDGNKFNITLANTGMLPAKIVRAWVTNTTDTNGWHKQYDNLNKLINPGGALTDFGQDLPLVAKTDKSYEIKVVTERGTTAVFKITNGNEAKLHVRLMASQATIPSGQRITITMLVIHNNTLADAVVNIEPEISITPSPSDLLNFATLVPGTPTPSKYSSILYGSTLSFTWFYEVTGQNNTQFTVQGGLKDGKSNTDSVTFHTRIVKFASSDYATNAGVLWMNYTSFNYIQGTGQWKVGWDVSASQGTGFKIDLINNNRTHALWVSKASVIVFDKIGTAADTPFYITNRTDPDGGDVGSDPDIIWYKCANPAPDDYCLKINSSDAGNNKRTLYFAATQEQGDAVNNFGGTGRYMGYILIFGKYCQQSDPMGKDCTGLKYAQNLPFIGVEAV